MWIYLSPHFDDAILSCGGLIWQQAQAGQRVEVWTVCAGDIPPGPLPPFAQQLHARWGTGLGSVTARRAEDEAACRAVGAGWRRFTLPDCIYRRLPGSGEPLVRNNDDLWQPIHPAEAGRVEEIRDWISGGLGAGRQTALTPKAHLVSPLTVGGHVDHRLVRAAAEALGVRLWYYVDYPYSVRGEFHLRQWLGDGYRAHSRHLSPAALAAWQAGVAAYTSQASTFWKDLEEMRQAIETYAGRVEGHALFRKGHNPTAR
jgi:LmbE family N-acetylglucosaminyl deacetylase